MSRLVEPSDGGTSLDQPAHSTPAGVFDHWILAVVHRAEAPLSQGPERTYHSGSAPIITSDSFEASMYMGE